MHALRIIKNTIKYFTYILIPNIEILNHYHLLEQIELSACGEAKESLLVQEQEDEINSLFKNKHYLFYTESLVKFKFKEGPRK